MANNYPDFLFIQFNQHDNHQINLPKNPFLGRLFNHLYHQSHLDPRHNQHLSQLNEVFIHAFTFYEYIFAPLMILSATFFSARNAIPTSFASSGAY